MGIDCSTKWTNVGLTDNGVIVGEINEDLGRKQSSMLPVIAEKLFSENNVKIGSICCIAVAVGPGYYTGIRTGIAYACALAEALKIKIVPLSTLKIPAYRFREDSGDFLAVFSKARKNYIYGALYKKDKSELNEVVGPAYLTEADFASKIAEYNDALIISIGDVSDYKTIQSLPNIKCGCIYNSGLDVAIFGEKLLKNSIAPDKIRGMYLRSPDIGPTQ